MLTPGRTLLQDYSFNAPTLPAVGAGTFGGAGPYAAYLLVGTVPADAGRQHLDIENLSGAQIAVILDDGSTAPGFVPAAGKATVFALSGATSAGAQGSAWSDAFQGRVQIYAPASSALVAVYSR